MTDPRGIGWLIVWGALIAFVWIAVQMASGLVEWVMP